MGPKVVNAALFDMSKIANEIKQQNESYNVHLQYLATISSNIRQQIEFMLANGWTHGQIQTTFDSSSEVVRVSQAMQNP